MADLRAMVEFIVDRAARGDSSDSASSPGGRGVIARCTWPARGASFSLTLYAPGWEPLETATFRTGERALAVGYALNWLVDGVRPPPPPEGEELPPPPPMLLPARAEQERVQFDLDTWDPLSVQPPPPPDDPPGAGCAGRH